MFNFNINRRSILHTWETVIIIFSFGIYGFNFNSKGCIFLDDRRLVYEKTCVELRIRFYSHFDVYTLEHLFRLKILFRLNFFGFFFVSAR